MTDEHQDDQKDETPDTQLEADRDYPRKPPRPTAVGAGNFNIDDDLLLELLRHAGFINDKAKTKVSECQKFKNGLHVAQILIMNGHVTPRDLKSAFDAVSAVREGKMTFEEAVVVLRETRKQT